MSKNCLWWDYLLLTIGLISLIYFILITMVSRFIMAYLFFPLLSLLTLIYAVIEIKSQTSILSSLPKGINYSIKALLIIGTILFIALESQIIYHGRRQNQRNSDYVIVLGARLNGSNPSLLLRYRLDATIKYHQQHPNSYIIVSGGQGDGETISEAKAMKKYLIERNIDENIIIEENQSTNTNENISFSKAIIESMTNDDYTVTIITNGFHCYRSLILANKHDLDAVSYCAKERLDVAPYYYLREFFGCLKDLIIT